MWVSALVQVMSMPTQVLGFLMLPDLTSSSHSPVMPDFCTIRDILLILGVSLTELIAKNSSLSYAITLILDPICLLRKIGREYLPK